MKKTCRKSKVEYIDGYNHYGKKKTIQLTFFISEAEKAALDDLMAVLEVKNLSAFVRGQAFKAYNSLTPEQKEKMREVAEWRSTEDEPSLVKS